MGARPPHTVIAGKARHSNKNSPRPAEVPVSHVQHRRQPTPARYHPPRPAPRSVRFRFEIGPAQPDQTDVEARTASSRAKATCDTSEPSESSRPAEPDRSRAGVRPISTRKWTDLAAECDRSRAGSGPISTRSATDLGAELDRSRGGAHEPARDRPVRLPWRRFAACGPCPERPRLNSCSRPLRTGA